MSSVLRFFRSGEPEPRRGVDAQILEALEQMTAASRAQAEALALVAEALNDLSRMLRVTPRRIGEVTIAAQRRAQTVAARLAEERGE